MSALWSLDAMATAMHAARAGSLPSHVSGISIDSRTLTKGDAFFAIQGENRDGHEFVDGALKARATTASPDRSSAFPVRRFSWFLMCSKACAILRLPLGLGYTHASLL